MQAPASGMGYNLLHYTLCLLESEESSTLTSEHPANSPPPSNTQHISTVSPFVYLFIRTHILPLVRPPRHSSLLSKADHCVYFLVRS